jgi:hypothetical protein
MQNGSGMNTGDTKDSPRWQLEAERLKAEILEALRHNQEWRNIRRAEERQTDWQAVQATEIIYKTAMLYDGLGNAEKAVDHYRKFLDKRQGRDELTAFARKRIKALGNDHEGKKDRREGDK